MKLLVVTKETQGKRRNDFSHADEGEIVTFGFECSRESVDGKCGCKRAMVGLGTRKATTTMKVVDIAITRDELIEKILASEHAAGFVSVTRDQIVPVANELKALADRFRIGAVVERRGSKIRGRTEGAEEEKPEKDDASFLRDLAERLMHVPVMYGTDQGDTDRLNEIAAGM